MEKELKFVEGCVFCNIGKGEVQTTFLYNDDEIIAFNDINPKAPIHILVLPKTHIASVREVGDDEGELMGKMLIVARDLARERNLTGYKILFNVGRDGGQIVEHLHMHLLGGGGIKML